MSSLSESPQTTSLQIQQCTDNSVNSKSRMVLPPCGERTDSLQLLSKYMIPISNQKLRILIVMTVCMVVTGATLKPFVEFHQNLRIGAYPHQNLRIGAYPTMLTASACVCLQESSRRRLMPVMSYRNPAKHRAQPSCQRLSPCRQS